MATPFDQLMAQEFGFTPSERPATAGPPPSPAPSVTASSPFTSAVAPPLPPQVVPTFLGRLFGTGVEGTQLILQDRARQATAQAAQRFTESIGRGVPSGKALVDFISSPEGVSLFAASDPTVFTNTLNTIMTGVTPVPKVAPAASQISTFNPLTGQTTTQTVPDYIAQPITDSQNRTVGVAVIDRTTGRVVSSTRPDLVSLGSTQYAPSAPGAPAQPGALPRSIRRPDHADALPTVPGIPPFETGPREHIRSHAGAFSASPNLVRAVIAQESNGDPNARGQAGEIGLMQILPGTAASPGLQGVQPVDPNTLRNPQANVAFGTSYLNGLLTRYQGDLSAALIGYNAGMTVADAYLRAGRDLRQVPASTQQYIADVHARLGIAVPQLGAVPAQAQQPGQPGQPSVPPVQEAPLTPQRPGFIPTQILPPAVPRDVTLPPLWNMVPFATGLIPGLLAGGQSVLGQFGVDVQPQHVEFARGALRSASRELIRAIQQSPRYAEGERVSLTKDFTLDPTLFTTERALYTTLDFQDRRAAEEITHLQREFANPDTATSRRGHITEMIAVYQRFRDRVSVPPMGSAERTNPRRTGAREQFQLLRDAYDTIIQKAPATRRDIEGSVEARPEDILRRTEEAIRAGRTPDVNDLRRIRQTDPATFERLRQQYQNRLRQGNQ